ncbi:MAG: M14 family zinc carboxypeptidase [Salinivirgaceae bacterium]|jgi:murein tripeptide amidase MpaA|nr:M14 family zinc carboxypeptidase [Salinivirgaceae bacterium]
MKKLLLLAVFSIVFLVGFAQQPREYIIEMNFNNQKEIQKLTRLMSIDAIEDGKITAYVNPGQLDKLNSLGYEYTIVPKPDLSKRVINMATTVAEMADWDRYPTYEVYVEMMEQFATDYPDICKLDTIGQTNDGRLLLTVKISDNVLEEENEAEVFYTSSMHGDETTGFVLHLRLIDYLLSNYGTDDEVDELVNNLEIWINPAANPDGTYASGNSTVSGSTRSNANGVDLNRNFPDPKGGDHPDGQSWQIETVAMMHFADEHSFVLSQNTHGGIELVNYPWDTWTRLHPDDNWWVRVSRDYADMAQANSPSGYMTAQNNGITNGAAWYIVEGGRQDYMNYFKQCREFVLEISDSKTLSTDLLPDYWGYNKQALLNYMKEAMYGIKGIVTNQDDEPLFAEIHLVDHDQDNSYVVTDPEIGDFHRMVEAGTYTVEVRSYGYVPQTLDNISSVDGEVTLFNVQLSQAQTVEITGEITDAITGLPIEGATISLANTPIDPVETNSAGQYTISEILEDAYTIIVYADGYAGVREDITISTDNLEFSFELSPVNAISFENGLPDNFSVTGDANWAVTDATAFHGSNSLKSGAITDGQSTMMEFSHTYASASQISFALKTDSESGYDKLVFYIDGDPQDDWSGNISWQEVTFDVDEGEHTFKWEYSKDGSVGNGADAVWIDYIQLPANAPTEPVAAFSATELVFPMSQLPEPVAADSLTITNVGVGTLLYTTMMQAGTWASITSEDTDLENGESAYITVEVDAGQMEDGTYHDTLMVVADDSYKLPVTMTVLNGLATVNPMNVAIYPNPSQGNVHVDADERIETVVIYNLAGRKVFDLAYVEAQSVKINPGLNAGIYMIRIKTTHTISTQKLFIE